MPSSNWTQPQLLSTLLCHTSSRKPSETPVCRGNAVGRGRDRDKEAEVVRRKGKGTGRRTRRDTLNWNKQLPQGRSVLYPIISSLEKGAGVEMPRKGNEHVQKWPASQGKDYRNSNRTQGPIQSSPPRTPWVWEPKKTLWPIIHQRQSSLSSADFAFRLTKPRSNLN